MNQTATVSTGRPTLVLNAASQPLGAIPLSRAVALTMTGRATPLAFDGVLRSPTTTIDAPTVIVRTEWADAPTGVLTRVTRSALFARDNWTCAWCGRHARPGGDLRQTSLTIDHLIPQARYRKPGERHKYVPASHRWDNVVCACRPCNGRRGSEDPDWASLRVVPRAPSRLVVMSRQLARVGRGAWDAYLPAAA
ncbi:HNH endonuclease [Euzebya pacifica]|nr:HNH endonuclease [Euzebya pacifica]